MKKLFLFLSLAFLCIHTKAQFNDQPRLGNVDFVYLADKVSIKYDFVNCSPSDKYVVWAEAYFDSGTKIDAKTWIGAVGNVAAGVNNQIVWDIKKDGLQIEQSIYFKLFASKMPASNVGKGLLYSTLLPGAGHKQAGAKRNALVLGVLGYGGVGGALAFNSMAKSSMDKYNVETDPTKRDKYYADAKSQNTSSLISAGVAVGIWALDYAIVASKYKKTKTITPEQIKANPQTQMIVAETPHKKVSTRGLPPNLFAELAFTDANGNGILEAEEAGELTVKITNQGKGDALKLDVLLKDSITDPNLQVSDHQVINVIKPGMSAVVKFPMKTNIDLRTNKHKFEIMVKESYGFDMESAYLRLPTFGYQAPKFMVSGYEIIDFGDGTGAITEDGQLQLGEQVKVKVTVQNVGQGTAKDGSYAISTTDANIFTDNTSGKLGTMEPGATKTFVFTLAPNKRVVPVDKSISLNLAITDALSKGNYAEPLRIALNQKPKKANIVNVVADINSLKKDIAVFVTSGNKFSANIANLTDIKTIKPSATKRSNALGVVLGIGRYENMAPAPYADNDALLVKEYFTKVLGITNVISMTNQEVTISRLKKIFSTAAYGDLKKNINDSTEVFVFYSGHGVPDKSGDNTYLFPYDGDKEGLEEFAFNMETFYNNLNQLGAKHVTLFIDACFSGFSKQSQTIQSQNLVAQKGVKIKPKKLWLNNPKFTVFTSSTGEETSLGFDASETGLFSYYLCAGLQGKADANSDHKITSGELRQYILKNVKETSVKISGLQTPEFSGDEDRVLVEY